MVIILLTIGGLLSNCNNHPEGEPETDKLELTKEQKDSIARIEHYNNSVNDINEQFQQNKAELQMEDLSSSGDEEYRITIYSSAAYRGNPYSVKFYRNNDTSYISERELKTRPKYTSDIGGILTSVRPISSTYFDTVRSAFESINFWNLRTTELVVPYNRWVSDYAYIFIEAYKDEKYHMVGTNQFSDNIKDVFNATIVYCMNYRGRQEREKMWEEFINAPKTNSQIDTIKELMLNYGLETLPVELLSYKNLETLYLGYNKLNNESLAMLCQLKKLRYLSLDFNELEQFPENILCLKNLEALSIRVNNITSIPEKINELKKLKELDLEKNNLTELPSSICKLAKLEMLSIDENDIKTLPSCLTELKNLKTMYIPAHLEYFPKELAHTLSNAYTYHYRTIGNFDEIKDLIPKD